MKMHLVLPVLAERLATNLDVANHDVTNVVARGELNGRAVGGANHGINIGRADVVELDDGGFLDVFFQRVGLYARLDVQEERVHDVDGAGRRSRGAVGLVVQQAEAVGRGIEVEAVPRPAPVPDEGDAAVRLSVDFKVADSVLLVAAVCTLSGPSR